MSFPIVVEIIGGARIMRPMRRALQDDRASAALGMLGRYVKLATRCA
jgi:hypothetical protein